jgi:nucleoside diphosphate kinase
MHLSLVGQSHLSRFIHWLCSGPVVALALRKENAIKEWRELMGPTDATVAKRQAPYTYVSDIS